MIWEKKYQLMKIKTPELWMSEYDKSLICPGSPSLLCADYDGNKCKEILRKVEGVCQVANLDFRKGS